jgi:hypothetical protein
MSLPLVGLAPYSPIDQVTPFTYRDNDTYLTILYGLRSKVDDIINSLNELSITDSTNLNTAIADLSAQFNTALNALEASLEKLIEGSHDESIAFDPTNGTTLEGLSTVISRVYDNLRLYAYFAKQYDDLQLTALTYDNMQVTARHFDLAITYPTLNDVAI